jgi:hypothetical protein
LAVLKSPKNNKGKKLWIKRKFHLVVNFKKASKHTLRANYTWRSDANKLNKEPNVLNVHKLYHLNFYTTSQ